MPLRVFALRSLMDSSIVRGLLVVGMYSTFFFGALWLEHVRGFGAVATGVAFLPMTLTVASLSLGTSARMMERFGPAPHAARRPRDRGRGAAAALDRRRGHRATSRPCSSPWRCSASAWAPRCSR